MRNSREVEHSLITYTQIQAYSQSNISLLPLLTITTLTSPSTKTLKMLVKSKSTPDCDPSVTNGGYFNGLQ